MEGMISLRWTKQKIRLKETIILLNQYYCSSTVQSAFFCIMTDLTSLKFQSILIHSLMSEQRCHLRFAVHRKDVQD